MFIWDKNGIKISKAHLLHVAAFSGSNDCVKYLIQCGADISALDIFFEFLNFFHKIWKNYINISRTPLYFASMAGHNQIVKLLLETGADPNCRDIYSH